MNISDDILLFIPQRHPFVMVDRLLHADDKKASTNFKVTAENIFFEQDGFSEAGLLENIAQTVAAGAGYKQCMENKPVAGGYIAAIKDFEVFFLPELNNVLITEIIVTGKVFNVTVINGKVFSNNVLAAQCEMKIFANTTD